MHVFAPSSARGLLRELKRFQTSFSGHKCIKNVWRPDSARTRWGSLSDPPEPLAVRVAASRPEWALRGHGGRVRFVGGRGDFPVTGSGHSPTGTASDIP